jgi:hypothetical protein
VNVGVSVENNVLYLVVKNSDTSKPSFHKSNIAPFLSDKNKSSGYIWDQISDEEIKNTFRGAEKVAFTIPARICFSKIISMDMNINRDRKGYQAWVARNQLPGEISDYMYGFLPLSEESTSDRIEVIFYATFSKHFQPLFDAVIKEEDRNRTNLVPEYMGLGVILTNAVDIDSEIQAAIISSREDGAAVTSIRKGSICSIRYFPKRAGRSGDFLLDLETHLLSIFDSDAKTEIYIVGNRELQDFDPRIKAKIRYNRMPVGFISALGSVEYISTGGRCELPAGN